MAPGASFLGILRLRWTEREAESVTDMRGTSKQKPRSLWPTLIVLAGAAPVLALSPWLLSVGLILGCGIFVAYEFSLVKIPVRELERDVEAGVAGAAQALAMKHDMNAMLAACQFGITLTSLGLTLALEPAIHHALEGYAAIVAYSVGLAMFIGAFLHVTFGELIPKGLALVVPKQVLYTTAPFMSLFRFLAIPFIKTCNTIANAGVQMITGKNPDKDAHHDEGMEIGEALLYAHARGQIKPDQLKVMRNVLAFAARSVREVMTPATLVVALDLQEDWDQNRQVVDEHRYSRYPVIDGDWHAVVGYVRKDDILRSELKGERNLRALLLPIERRPETVHLNQVNLFQGSPMIALYDEYDAFVGLLTAEDVVEQIVGEIYDETDDQEAPTVVPLGDGSYWVCGKVLVGELVQTLDLDELQEEYPDVDTIGGVVITLLGRQPRPGDVVTLFRYSVTVESTHGFRVGKLRFAPLAAFAPEVADVTTTGHTGV
jgi:CBS domain containing-hemolysin-like protein